MNNLNIIATALLSLFITTSYGQINIQDSTAKVLSYWYLGDQYDYEVSMQKLQISEADTLSNETFTYDVNVSVIDSTENSYTVRWHYKNYNSDSDNPVIQKIISTSEDIKVDIITDELGIIESIANWEEVRDYMIASFDSLKTEIAHLPGMEAFIEQNKSIYATEESIEAAAIQDAQQFHNFHGVQFKLNDTILVETLSPNVYYNDKPFDTDIVIILEDIDTTHNEIIIRSITEVDSEQLTETTFNYLTEMSKKLGTPMVNKDEFDNLHNDVETVSLIHMSGWVIESKLWKEVYADGITQMEIRIITMK